MNKLIALVPILYLSKLYSRGETLPAGDTVMVEAWIENNSAKWTEGTPSYKEEKSTEVAKTENEPPAEKPDKTGTEESSSINENTEDNAAGASGQQPTANEEQEKATKEIKRRNK